MIWKIDYITPILDQHFKYDKIFNLFDYDHRLEDLHEELKQLRRPEYESNYRFIFSHYDTDYYITNDQPGILLRNLQRIIWSLDISNFFCLILSQQRLQHELDRIRAEETTDDVSIACITHALQHRNYLKVRTQDMAPDLIDKHFICLNRQLRLHRTVTFNLLKDKDLLEKGMVSFGNRLSTDVQRSAG